MITKLPIPSLSDQIREYIDGLGVGGKLLPEPQLARKLSVSRATLREVLRVYEEQGWIDRRQGKGTFVTQAAEQGAPGWERLESLEALAARSGVELSVAATQIREIPAEGDAAEALGLQPGDLMLQVAQVLHAGSKPAAFLVDILPASLTGRKALEKELQGTVLAWLLGRAAPALAGAQTEFEALAAPAGIARPLEIRRGDALLFVSSLCHTPEGQAVLYSLGYFIPGILRFSLRRGRGSGL